MKKTLVFLTLLVALTLVGGAMAEEMDFDVVAEAVDVIVPEADDVLLGDNEPVEEVGNTEFVDDSTDYIMSDTAVLANSDDFEIINGILVKYNGVGGDVVIPDGVTQIADSVFAGRSDLNSIVIPNTVTSIGKSAFAGCNLISISIPDGVKTVKENSFYGNSNLTTVILPNSITSIDDNAFMNCSSLTSINIPMGVESIGMSAFFNCPSLMDIYLPNSLKSIKYCAFGYCTGLTEMIIPSSVREIETNAFQDCSNLTNVSIPEGITSLERNLFAKCSSLTSIVIPSSVTIIDEGAFANCTELVDVSIPNSVKSIKGGAFFHCTQLKSVILPDGVFISSSSWTNYGGAFKNCYNLMDVTIMGASNIVIVDDTFENCPSSITFHTLCESSGTKWAEAKGYTVDKTPHTPIEDDAVAPTCTETGLTEGKHCSVCNEVLVAQEVVPAKGHTEVIDEAVEPTYTSTGLTQGSHCSVCGEVLVAQVVIPALTPTVAPTMSIPEVTVTPTVAPTPIPGIPTIAPTMPITEPTVTPTVAPVSMAEAKITVEDQTYTGKALKPAVKVKLDGKTLKKGTDYTVSYKNNKAIGRATVTVGGKGAYAGTVKTTFHIKPKKVSGLKLKAGTKQLTVSWKKSSGVTGYEVQYGLKKTFSGAKTVVIKKAATVKTELKKLKAKKTYYVRIRAYKTVKGTKYYSDWSKAVKMKTK